jgi:hypothetical protein
MINNLTVSSPFLTTSSYNSSHIGANGQSAGQMRYNTSLQQVEVYDGVAWIMISQNTSVGLSYEAEEAIRWAQTKRAEETELKTKMEKYPTLKSAYEQFKMIEALVYEEEKSGA